MTEEYRGPPEEQTAMSKFFRKRWKYKSVYVLDIDRLVCSPDGERGILIEEKHESSEDKTPTITRKIARKCGWWAALFVYSTDDGTIWGTVMSIDADFWGPRGEHYHKSNMNFASFDEWICKAFGAEPLGAEPLE